MVKDGRGNPFIIIECKTYGDEFEREWKKMFLDGGQLFSYFQQARSACFLCLFASDVTEGKRVYRSHIISVKDNAEYLKPLKDPKTFVKATDVGGLFSAWRDTYGLEYETRGLFEEGAGTSGLGTRRRKTADLNDMTRKEIQGLYHAFATILRQHNVSARENAFDRLVNLFLAKIADETLNPEDLEFCWKGTAFDDFYRLLDRLQRLYRDGIRLFMDEEIVSVDRASMESAFRMWKTDPYATRKTILRHFCEMKFHSDSDFAFIDVHNERLFIQNSRILVKIVLMLQDMKIRAGEPNQLLGDLFEGFLDGGVRQSEGQYFTPMPIARFLVSSLPIGELVMEGKISRMVDYACGPGHFLNEYAQHLASFAPATRLPEFRSAVTGTEKEYRLSKAAKVAAIMLGHPEIGIVCSDALSRGAAVKDGTFDVLV
jgi:type I restriction-modification system DNA methylase subunit